MQQQQAANQTLMNSLLNMMQQLGAMVTAAVAKQESRASQGKKKSGQSGSGQGNFTETVVQEVQKFDKNLKLLILSWMGGDAFLRSPESTQRDWPTCGFRQGLQGRSATSSFVFFGFLAQSHTQISKQIYKAMS